MNGVSAMPPEMFYVAYSNAIAKKSMDSMEDMAMSLINEMVEAVEAVQAPSQYNFDVYG